MNEQVLCFGEVLWDTFDDGKQVGGAPLNVARQLAQQNVSSLMITRIGDDASGEELRSYLQQHGLDSPLVQTDSKLPTCEVTVQLDQDQQATYIIPEPVSWDNIQLTDEVIRYAEQAKAIVFGSLACRQQGTRNTLLDLLTEVKVPLRIFDVNLRPPHYDNDIIETLAAMANVVKMNEEEATLLIHGSHASLKDQILEFQHKYHTQTICVTRGGNGAMIWHNEEFYEHPGFKVDVMDTVGAGDAFLATLVAGLINEQPMSRVLEKACKVGSYVASQRGANPPPMAV
ncbi:carbohydrate kinase [Mucilaginibacter daejeonensis]|uniref:carbohydrate kinase family protein n=1 Tax=Mucilaginibacter daejeonensis TaxID=398049 RepID=UPI001D172293|nr:carbohydrate kinase [Mucilaginibacter daejeonensis]UEG54238.1 carbohydrate kinase [Mucilaginibacter daejeonensis]